MPRSRWARASSPTSSSPPFEMAMRIGGARSVMPTYIDLDGMPASADPSLLTDLLRDELGFDGLVVSDYFAVSFLQLQHRVAADPAGAAGAGARGRARRGAAEHALLRRAAAGGGHRGRRPRGADRPRGRPGARGRSSSSACSTPAGHRSRPTASGRRGPDWTRPRNGTSPGGWPRSRWCCSPTTGRRCRCRRRPGSPSSGRWPTTRSRSSAATHAQAARAAWRRRHAAGVEVATVLAALRAERPRRRLRAAAATSPRPTRAGSPRRSAAARSAD